MRNEGRPIVGTWPADCKRKTRRPKLLSFTSQSSRLRHNRRHANLVDDPSPAGSLVRRAASDGEQELVPLTPGDPPMTMAYAHLVDVSVTRRKSLHHSLCHTPLQNSCSAKGPLDLKKKKKKKKERIENRLRELTDNRAPARPSRRESTTLCADQYITSRVYPIRSCSDPIGVPLRLSADQLLRPSIYDLFGTQSHA